MSFDWLRDHGYFWLSFGAPALLIVAGVLYWRALPGAWWRQFAIDDARADELATNFGEEFEVRGELAWGWPVIFTLLLLFFSTFAWGTDFTLNPATGVAAGLFAVTIAAWWFAIQRHGVHARFMSGGLDIQGTYIPWRSVVSINADIPPLQFRLRGMPRLARLSLHLMEPVSTLGFRTGLVSGVSLDHTQRVIFISLQRTAESPAVIFQLATALWERAR